MKTEEDLSFEDIEMMVRYLPLTWYPALLIAVIEAAYAHNVFLNGGASKVAARVEKRLHKEAETGKEDV
jgi:hypothetical protein